MFSSSHIHTEECRLNVTCGLRSNGPPNRRLVKQNDSISGAFEPQLAARLIIELFVVLVVLLFLSMLEYIAASLIALYLFPSSGLHRSHET